MINVLVTNEFGDPNLSPDTFSVDWTESREKDFLDGHLAIGLIVSGLVYNSIRSFSKEFLGPIWSRKNGEWCGWHVQRLGFLVGMW